jgi:hypothetical protein
MQTIDALSNNDPGPVRQSTDGRLCQHNQADEIVRRGQEAMQRIRRGFEDWMDIAEALAIGRAEVMSAVHTNQPTGPRYKSEMAEWLLARGFHLIDKGARNRLLDCLKHRVEIEKWRATLTDGQRFRFNHPDAVLRKWRDATVVIDPNAPKKNKKKSPTERLTESVIRLEEENHRMQREIERSGGDLWTPEDTPKEIAKIMVAKLSTTKAEHVARAILAQVKLKKNTAPAAAAAETYREAASCAQE